MPYLVPLKSVGLGFRIHGLDAAQLLRASKITDVMLPYSLNDSSYSAIYQNRSPHDRLSRAVCWSPASLAGTRGLHGFHVRLQIFLSDTPYSKKRGKPCRSLSACLLKLHGHLLTCCLLVSLEPYPELRDT